MGAISEFVAAFERDYTKYLAIEEEVRVFCKEALQGIGFVWHSRVKAVESLERKLRDREDNYDDEKQNVADIVDLIGGRIILVRWEDIQRVENIISKKFDLRNRVQHPKSAKNRVGFGTRFRGYGALHLQVKRRGPSNQQSYDPISEIQVMTGFMWTFMELEHDIVYKQSHGEPTEDLIADLEALKGLANLGEINLMMYDRHFVTRASPSSQESDISPDFLARIRTGIDRLRLDEKDVHCLQDLILTDPRCDMERIEARKDQLLEGSCSWVLEDPAFDQWWSHDDSQFLWIHGDPGKGKTMMTIALIAEVSKRLNDRPGSNVLAYFFCENTNDKLNTTVSVLRGLIYQLVDQKKMLLRHIRDKYDIAGRRLFEDENALYALKRMFFNMLNDPALENVYFMIDGLDECDSTIHELLEWIIRRSYTEFPKIKFLVTSRNEQAFIERLGHGHQLEISLEKNSAHVAHAVEIFIDYKTKELANFKLYASELQEVVRKHLYEKAEGTFLWVALVCKELRKIGKHRAKSFLEKTPAGLEPFYKRILKQVLCQEDKDDVKLCRQILCSVTLAFRPLRLEEIAVFAKIPEQFHDPSDLKSLVSYCGSFITIRENTAYLVHQSAKDFLSGEKGKEIFHSGQENEHANTASFCLTIMAKTLKKNLCNFKTPGICLSNVEKSVSAILTKGAHIPFHTQYACLYWVAHLQHTGPTEQKTLISGQGCEVYEFFQHHFLHWLEALSLMSKVSEAIFAIKSLCSIPRVNAIRKVL